MIELIVPESENPRVQHRKVGLLQQEREKLLESVTLRRFASLKFRAFNSKQIIPSARWSGGLYFRLNTEQMKAFESMKDFLEVIF